MYASAAPAAITPFIVSPREKQTAVPPTARMTNNVSRGKTTAPESCYGPALETHARTFPRPLSRTVCSLVATLTRCCIICMMDNNSVCHSFVDRFVSKLVGCLGVDAVVHGAPGQAGNQCTWRTKRGSLVLVLHAQGAFRHTPKCV